uniref:2-(3-amino-3-carboxypropyl)histidine synthase subunit 1 n=1 Tax=Biomphalaria glabrata TaxID=6526 RepID=A0A2C9KZL2_BIOGL
MLLLIISTCSESLGKYLQLNILSINGIAEKSAKQLLSPHYTVITPQSKPLSPGEILGCTSPKLTDCDVIIYLGDGRFHLESIMIHNPNLPDNSKKFYTSHMFRVMDSSIFMLMACSEHYGPISLVELWEGVPITQTEGIHMLYIFVDIKIDTVHFMDTLKLNFDPGTRMALVSTIQFVAALQNLKTRIVGSGKKYVIVLLSEIFPDKLQRMDSVDAWVQIACPRLSIDWGSAFSKPLLTPYELNVALRLTEWQETYPMDYYANDSLGPWTVNNEANKAKVIRKPRISLKSTQCCDSTDKTKCDASPS